MKRDCIPESLSRAFYSYGKVVARCPLPFLLTPIIATLLLGVGYFMIDSTSDLEYLYVPINAPGKVERKNVEETFLYNEKEYYSGMRRTRMEGLVRLLVKDKLGGNLFSDLHMRELYKLDAFVKDMTTEYKETTLRYSDVCARWKTSCADKENTFLIYMTNKTVEDVYLEYPVHMDGFDPYFWAMQLGGIKLNSDGYIYYFKAAMFYYNVQFELDNKTIQKHSIAWSKEITNQILEYESEYVEVYIETFESIEKELEKSIWEVGPLFTITFMILSAFAFTSLLMTDWVRGKPFISTAGLIAAMLGAVSGTGILLLCGVKFTTAIGAVPFLIIGIGMDDMYIMVSAWRCTSYTLPVETRTAQMMQHSAVSITITSITDALAFGIGIITPFRSVQLFCGYTLAGVIFCYFYQLSFTVACMVYDGRREHDNMHCITLRPIITKAEARKRSRAYRWFCTGGPVPPPDAKSVEEVQHLADPSKIKLPYVNEFMGTTFATFLMKTPVKFAVILSYGLYLGFAIYGITLLKEGLDRKNLVPDTSYYVSFMNDYEQHFGGNYGPMIMFVYDQPLNYTDPIVREEIKYNLETFKRNEYFFDNEYAVTSWLDYFEIYLSHTWRDLNDLTEEDLIRILRTEFFDISAFKTFISDITFDSTNSTIIASRMFIQTRGPKDSIEERDMMTTSRGIAKDSKYDAYTFHLAYTYFDMYTIIVRTTLQNLAIATISMLVVALIFIPSFVTVLWVTLTTISIEIGIVGYMVFCDIHLDSISMINLIMCIGFSVDFAAHISYHYTISKSDNPTQCARDALGHLGTPILQSALSTILGVAVLSMSQSYIFRTFFKIVSMVMLFGSFHGLFLLPVILSTIKAFNNDRRREAHITSQTDGGNLQNGQVVRCRPPGSLTYEEEMEYKLEIFLK